jgi:hypothetical protein
MLFINAVLALTLIGGAPQLRAVATHIDPVRPVPTRSCAAPAHTGTFRVTAMTADSTNSKVGMIILENIDGCLEASMITDEGGPAIIDHLMIAGDTITGSIRMTSGIGRVSLNVSQVGIAGSITEGRHQWRLAGRRTI